MNDKSPLEIKNHLKHKFSNIFFEPEEHRYFNDKKEEYQSVSSFLEQFIPAFDREIISKKVSQRQKVPQNEIKTQWTIRRDFSTVRGTEFHLYVETFLNENRKIATVTPIEKHIKLFHKFWTEKKIYKKHEIIFTELMVYSNKYKIAGTVDCLIRNRETRAISILDWKTNKKIKDKNPYSKKMKTPLNHLDNCEINKYSLQLGLYSKIISENTDLAIKGCFIIHFSEEMNDYRIYPTNNLGSEIDLIINSKNNSEQ